MAAGARRAAERSRWTRTAIPAAVGVSWVVTGGLGLVVRGGGARYDLVMVLLVIVGFGATWASIHRARPAAPTASTRLQGSIRSILALWADPPADWVMFVLGVALASPFLAFATPVLNENPDSARLVASLRYVFEEDWRYLLHTQESYLPFVLMGPLLSVGGLGAVSMASILGVLTLSGAMSLITWRLTGSLTAAVATVLSLFCLHGVTERATFLPMYALMLTLGYAGIYFTHQAVVTRGKRRLRYALLAGGCLAMSPEAHAVGQVFVLAPILLAIAMGWRRSFPAVIVVYVAVGLFALPRVVINVSEGGLSHLLSYRVDLWTTSTHLKAIQRDFFGYPGGMRFGDYLEALLRHAGEIVGVAGVALIVAALAGLVVARPRVRLFALLLGVWFLGPLLIARSPFFPRYFSPLQVGAAILVGVLASRLVERQGRKRWLGPTFLAGLFVAAWLSLIVELAHVRVSQERILTGPYRDLASHVTDGMGVIGSRSLYLLYADPDIATYGTQFLSEEELVTYLTWPSDDAVMQVLEDHDIGWALVTGERWEEGYNDAWLQPAYGLSARHLAALESSSSFCLAEEAPPFRLYRLGSCDPAAAP